MENYKPNSNRYKEEQKNNSPEKVEKIISGTVITKKKTKMNTFMSNIISDDAKNVKDYVLGEV